VARWTRPGNRGSRLTTTACSGRLQLAWDSRTVTYFTTGVAHVPEPATLALLGTGPVGVGAVRRRTPAERSRGAYFAAVRFSRSVNCLRNFATFGAITTWQ